MQVTLKDLAIKLGMAPSTVSRALKGHPDISEETKKRVRQLATELNYVPNAVALSLRSRQSKQIAVIVPEISSYFYASFINGVEKVMSREGYLLLLFQSHEEYNREEELCREIGSAGVAGVMVSIAKTTRTVFHFEELKKRGIPLLFYDRISGAIDTDRVVSDDFNGAYMAVEHLIREGCRKIIHYAGDQHLQIAQKRRSGYLEALRDNRLIADERYIVYCDRAGEAGELTSEMMEKYRPDAFFTFDDAIAIAVLQVLKKGGYQIPGQVAVCGFSNDPLTKVTDPDLTTIEQNPYEMGIVSAEMLLERMQAYDYLPTRTKLLKTALMIRGSSDRKNTVS